MASWTDFFHLIKDRPYSASLKRFLDEEYANKRVFPPRKDMFKAFELTPADEVKAVIVGVGSFAYRRDDGVQVIPLDTLGV